MANISKESIKIPSNVQVKLLDSKLFLEGPLGEMILNLAQQDKKGLCYISISEKEEEKEILLLSHASRAKVLLKSISALIKEYIHGLTRGFLINLEIVGVGYRAQIKESKLELRLGYSHSISYLIPQDVKVFTPKPTQICLFGIDKNRVTQVASNIRSFKSPEPYKGKGIRLKNETLLKKEGKKK